MKTKANKLQFMKKILSKITRNKVSSKLLIQDSVLKDEKAKPYKNPQKYENQIDVDVERAFITGLNTCSLETIQKISPCLVDLK